MVDKTHLDTLARFGVKEIELPATEWSELRETVLEEIARDPACGFAMADKFFVSGVWVKRLPCLEDLIKDESLDDYMVSYEIASILDRVAALEQKVAAQADWLHILEFEELAEVNQDLGKLYGEVTRLMRKERND